MKLRKTDMCNVIYMWWTRLACPFCLAAKKYRDRFFDYVLFKPLTWGMTLHLEITVKRLRVGWKVK